MLKRRTPEFFKDKTLDSMKFFKSVMTVLVLLALSTTMLEAQGSKLKRARKYMDELNYQEAIPLLNQYLEKNEDLEAKIYLAESYRKVNDSENSEYWYGQVVRDPGAQPVHKLFYGQMLQKNGKCDLAREWYESYVREVPTDTRGQFLLKACDYEEELMTKNAGVYEVNHPSWNSNLDDLSPAFFGDGIVFATERDQGGAIKRTSSWTGNPFLSIYYVDAKDEGEECGNYQYGTPKRFAQELNSKFHDAAVTFSGDQKQIYFTRNNYDEGKVGKSDDGYVKLKVYSASISGESWKDLQGLPFNSDEYSVAHPALTQDGSRLFFASDMPGGYGGLDLYVSEKQGGSWGIPVNLGPAINTEGHEMFPYYQKDGRLYFSSDGQIGLGGLDLFYMDDKGDGQWGEIVNMGAPINSTSDDFGIVFNESGTCGFFTSDRAGGAGRDDVYSFKKIASPVEVFVYDEATKEPIEGAYVLDECTGDTLTTNVEGKVMVDMKMDLCCNFKASKEEYQGNEKEGCTKDIAIGEPVFVEIPLNQESAFKIEGGVFDAATFLPLPGATVTLTNDCGEEEQTITADEKGLFEFEVNEDCCYTVKGTMTDYLSNKVVDQCTRGQETSLTMQVTLNLQPTKLTEEAITANENLENREPGQIDPTGIDPENKNDDGGIAGKFRDVRYNPDTDRYETKNGEPAEGWIANAFYKDGKITDGEAPSPIDQVVENETFDEGPSNGGGKIGEPVAYLLHIYYDFNQSYLREEADPELNKLLTLLQDNEEYIVEIGSHTDSRGSYAYNRVLSQRRAESVVRWLTKHGVDRNRLVAVGYGETRNVNKCKNAIPCSEQEHQMNRRTEFRILGSIADGYDVREMSRQRKKENVKTVPCHSCPF